MKTLKLTLLTLILILLTANERYVKYFIDDHAFITGNNVPKSEIIRKDHIRAEYDKLDRLLIKSIINASGEVLSQEQFSYIDQNISIRQKDLVDKVGHIFYKTIFGRESQSLSYIEWVFGVDSVKKWNDRFTTSDINEIDKPNNFRFFDVDAFEYGGKELDYDSLGRTTRDEWFRRPDGKSMHKFLYKYYDDLGITHLFEYDSNGVLIMDVKLNPDGTEAVFFFTGPSDSSFQNHSKVDYNLDGDLKWGFIDWAIPGHTDSARVDLKNLVRGDHVISLSNDSMLKDSALYDIHFDGEGTKGYMATKRKILNITYDISPPLLTLEMDKYIKDISISFTISEPIDSAYIVWSPDSIFNYIESDTVILTKEEIIKTDRFKPVNQKALVDGIMYDLKIYAIDRAGNLADPPGIMENVIYDITPPAITINGPISGEWLNHELMDISTSEIIKSWTIKVERQSGKQDDNSPYEHTFLDTVIDTSYVDLFEYFQLVDGVTYSYSVIASDLAGNLSETVKVDSIHYDITSPVLTLIYPYNDEAINNTSISYAASEQLSVGDFLWTQTDGLIDTLSPYKVELIGDELSSKEKIKVNLINQPLLNDGSYYSIFLTGRDLAGNESEPVLRTNILFDKTPPEFTNVMPESGSALNYQSVSYTLSEKINQGSIIWTQIGGEFDDKSPHQIQLADNEMRDSVYQNIDLINMVTLKDGGVYQIQFTGSDRAGNIADTINVFDLLYDFTAPEIVIEYPIPQSISNTTAISYNLSETLNKGEFSWVWLGGVEDTLAPYIAELSDLENEVGPHIGTALKNIPSVVENALYTLTFVGQDRAGNKTLKAFIPNLQYDFTPPQLTWISPNNGDAVNHKNIQFENSEILERGIITWVWIGGKIDPDSIHAMSLVNEELDSGVSTNNIIKNEPPLVDGGVYNISYIAFDPAGNESNQIFIENILYDITQPEISIVYPLPRSISRTSAVTYNLSEKLFEGQFKWRWLGGIEDTLAPYIASLSKDEMSVGEHAEIELSNNPTVVENALYTMTFVGKDRAGNRTKPAFVAGLQYDFTPPELTILYPTDGMAINNYDLKYINSELLESAQMIWQWTFGNPDSNSPHIIDLVGDELYAKEIGPISLASSPPLIDGGEYSLLYVAFDPAGNQSDTTRMDDIFYDVTPPIITINYPSSNIFTTETSIIFGINEDLYNFNINWKGKNISEPEDVVFYKSPNILTSGEINSDDLFIPELKDGYSYSITFEGQDRAGNFATPTELNDIKIDLTPPVFSAFYPSSEAFINKLDFGWNLSEDINAGTLTFISNDTLIIELSNNEKNGGYRDIETLSNMKDLKDGFEYSISIKGKDLAGNISEILTVDQINYDISPPKLAIVFPKSESFVNNLDVIYVVNEPLLIAQMVWIDDKGEKMLYDVRMDDLTSGYNTLKGYGINPKEDVPYDIIIDATDRANNDSSSDTVRNVMFDVTPPILSIQSPSSNQPINNTTLSFEISESIKMGTVSWQAVEGSDPSSPHKRSILGEKLKGGVFQGFTFISPPELVNGVYYNIMIEGTDLAGNKSEVMVVDRLLYDTVPPQFIDLKPFEGEYIKEPVISYTITEDLATGKIYFDYIGGENDPKATHMITLAGSKKQKGIRGGKLPSSFISLTNGAIYNIRFEGEDAAGNSASETIINNITFDNELPIILINEPINKSFFNNRMFSYSLSEDLVETNIVITREAGNPDSNSPHKISLKGDYLKSGDRLISDIEWVDGSTYSVTMIGVDRAGNNPSKISTLSQISYDITPPIITINNINNNNHIRLNTLSYALSEKISKSTIYFTQVGGAPDPSSPQTIELVGRELDEGTFNNIKLKNGPALMNGALYDIKMVGVDPAGNESSEVIISNITFDNEPPQVSISQPLDSEQIKNTVVSFISNEDLVDGFVIYRQTSGTSDINSPHRIPLKSLNLSNGVHSEIDLGFASQLADGGRYEVSIEAFDKAGNKANSTPINDVFFDVLPPNLALTEPSNGSHINSVKVSYGTSERLKKGSISFTRINGNEDPNSPHIIELGGKQLIFGDHFSESFDEITKLKDGSIYKIEFSGEDLAGNVAKNILINNVTYDTSKPLLSILSPSSNGFYSNIEMGIEINELLLSGKIIFEQDGGVNDPLSPHKIDLSNDQLKRGNHSGININTLTSLTANTVYNVSIEGMDLAGNQGVSESINNITFDNIPPNISIVSPAPNSYINSSTLGLKTNEVLSEAKVVWTWVDGTTDDKVSHESILVGDQLMDGLYPEVNFDPAPSLKSDARYKVIFYGTDRAGNESSFDLGNIYFDNMPPEIAGVFPNSNSFINLNEVEYSVNEQLLIGEIKWSPSDGLSSIDIPLSGNELNPGSFSKGKLTNQKELVDGTVYNIIISANDRAGNLSTITLAENVTYDKTKPKFTEVSPTTSARINSQLIKWTVNEELNSGKYTWIHMGGSEDTAAPHSFDLTPDLLKAGSFDNSTLGDLNLVADAMYRITLEGTDRGNNTGKKFIMSVVYDDKPPTLEIKYPESNTAVNNLDIAYYISESLSNGRFIYTQIGGLPDPNSPVTFDLTKGELESIYESPKTPKNPPVLNDGSIYNIQFMGQDLATNKSESNIIENVKYDITKPLITIYYPQTKSNFMGTEIDIEMSEDLKAGTMIWSRTGGLRDRVTKHKIPLYDQYLSAGRHEKAKLPMEKSLSASVVYSLGVEAVDFAGNVAEPVLIEFIEFIRSMAGNWYYKGQIIEVVWAFEPDETGLKGNFMQGLSLGSKISNQEKGQFTIDFSKKPWAITLEMENPDKNRISLFEFTDNTHIRVVTGEKKPSSLVDGEVMEYEWRPN